MDEETLRARAECWTRRAAESQDPRARARASDLLIASHYAALADLMSDRARVSAPADDEV